MLIQSCLAALATFSPNDLKAGLTNYHTKKNIQLFTCDSPINGISPEEIPGLIRAILKEHGGQVCDNNLDQDIQTFLTLLREEYLQSEVPTSSYVMKKRSV
jgi:hypothetical protein